MSDADSADPTPDYTSADLGVTLDDLWSDEGCSWHFDFDGGAGTISPWQLTLEWTQEYGNEHHADWTTHYWQFYGVTVEEALTEAIAWCEALLPFERCGACDGTGAYGPLDGRVVCEDCEGTGLANREVA